MYTIDSDNNITALAANEEASGDVAVFDSEAALINVSKDWPMTRLVEIWNSLPGERPVKKFENRVKAATRIFSRLRELGINGGEAPAKPAAKKAAATKRTPVAETTTLELAKTKPAGLTRGDVKKSIAKRKAKHQKNATTTTKRAPKPEGGESKKDVIVRLASRAKGATLDEIMAETGWQRHSVRGAIATLGREHQITSSKTESGQRHYQIA